MGQYTDKVVAIDAKLDHIVTLLKGACKPTISYHDPCSGRTWVQDEELADLRSQAKQIHLAQQVNHDLRTDKDNYRLASQSMCLKIQRLKARVHEVIAECWEHANKVKELEQKNADLDKYNASLGEANGKLRVQLGEAHKVEYKGRVRELQDLCRKREREVVRLRLERNNLDTNVEMYKGQHETDKRIHAEQAKIIRNLRRDLTTAQHCQPCGLHRVACPKCGGC